MERVPVDILTAVVSGNNLQAGTFADQLDPHRPTLVIFLRHFGCAFCKEMVKDVRAAAEASQGYPPALFIFQGEPEDGEEFFAKAWPGSRAIADGSFRYYDAFGITRGTFMQTLGPAVWGCGMRALAKGHVNRRPVHGDPWRMPGLFLIEADGKIVWCHRFKHVGDHPDWTTVPSEI